MRKSPGKIPRSSQSSDLSRDRRTPATHSPRLRSVPDSLPPSCFSSFRYCFPRLQRRISSIALKPARFTSRSLHPPEPYRIAKKKKNLRTLHLPFTGRVANRPD
ncbi:hypothetical protein CGCSCA4_v006802 [Colletotrichum siamense]|uniref:Uncharacterized protein n=1 Tax=Colletotrichum siamense TaxID=690259 RepID=A0A9P5EWY9_COLSI|nr:hypothetical protein CGCSCA4_v006802 [Colletotrichum siamense]KAF4860847.1 hypothetical protein CGCSCA2_v005090 [Colletotrichum siamense]